MDAEICGVLLGGQLNDCTLVDACIAGEKAAQGAAHVTFTQDTWEHIYSIKDRDYPDKKIVGWYHSHPGFGVFLSHHDTFIHENFFSATHQVAWVFDPHSDEEGCFGWSGGKVRRLQRFEVSTAIPDAPPQPEPEPVLSPEEPIPAPQTQTRPKGLRGTWERIPVRWKCSILLAALAVLLVIVAVQVKLIFGPRISFRWPSPKQLIEKIQNTIRRPSSPPLKENESRRNNAGEISPQPVDPSEPKTGAAPDGQEQEARPATTNTTSNDQVIGQPDLPGPGAAVLPDTALPEQN